MTIDLFISFLEGGGWINWKLWCIIITSFNIQISDNWFIYLPPIKKRVNKLKIIIKVSQNTQGLIVI